MSSLIQFVGNPFVDAGIAVLEGRIGKAFSEFTPLDLSKQASELDGIYSQKAWLGYLTVPFAKGLKATTGSLQTGDQYVELFPSRRD